MTEDSSRAEGGLDAALRAGKGDPSAPTQLEESRVTTAEEARGQVAESLARVSNPGPDTAPGEMSPSAMTGAGRSLVGGETGEEESEQASVPESAFAQLIQQQQARFRAVNLVFQAVFDEIYADNLESLRAELMVLRERELPALRDPDLPLRERLAVVDFVRERRLKLEQQIAEMEATMAERMTETSLLLREVQKHSSTVSEPHPAAEPQSPSLAGTGAQPLNMDTRQGWRSWRSIGLVVAAVTLIVAVAVGLTAILLPRQGNDPDPGIVLELAALYQATGNAEAARRVLDDVVEAGVKDGEILARLGQVYHELREYDRAVTLLAQAAEKRPQDPEIRLALARSYGSSGQHREAIAEYERLLQDDPDNVQYHTEMGHRYTSLKEYDSALAQYQTVLDIDPGEWRAHYYQGNVYRGLERYDEALKEYQDALSLYPSYYWTWLYMGQSYAGKNDHAKAIEQYLAALEIDPNQAEAHLYLGEAYLAEGDFDQAKNAFETTIDLQPDRAAAHLGLGRIYAYLDDCEQATAEFLAVLKLEPDNAEAQVGLTGCLEE